MRLVKFTTIIAIGALLILSIPAFADNFTIFNNPGDGNYLTATTNYGGGDGSGGTISSLGTFNFSNLQTEVNVPNSWATWNCPPFTESCTPNALWNQGFSTLTLTLTAQDNVAGFELEPDNFAVETVDASFFNQNGALIATITRDVNGSGGALLFALADTTPGSWISRIDITDEAGGDFAIAQLRQGGASGTTPEPGTMVLLGTGLLGALGVMRRKLNV
jgi:PEP-CTERM motif